MPDPIIDSIAPVASQEATKLLQTLQLAKVRFVHWKSSCRLGLSVRGKTDLDILIHPGDKKVFHICMQHLGYKPLKSPTWGRYPELEDWLAMDDETQTFLHLHIHFILVTGIKFVKHLYLPWTDTLLNNTLTDPETGWPIPMPEIEAIILLIRISAKKPPLSSKDSIPEYLHEELAQLLNKSDISSMAKWCKELQLNLPPDFEPRLQLLAKTRDEKEILSLSEVLYHQVKPHFRLPWAEAVVISLYYQFDLKYIRRVLSMLQPLVLRKQNWNGGKIIAFVGSDGSGKSTITTELIEWLSFKLDCHYCYLGKQPHIISHGKMIKSYINALYEKSFFSRAVKKLLGDHYYLLLIKRKAKILQLGQHLKNRGSIVICDRYPQTQFHKISDGMILQEKGQTLARKERKWFEKALQAEPDIVFRLVVSPDVASKRKPEHEEDIIQQKCDIIKQLKFPGIQVININADQPYNEVICQIKRKIWEIL